jgi:hypothetical protein
MDQYLTPMIEHFLPIFYSFEAVLTHFTLLEFAKIEKCSATFTG